MKIMLVAFIGTHVPLLTLVCFLLIPSLNRMDSQQLQILGITLSATLIGTLFTLLALYNLLTPVILTSKALETYQNQRVLPSLPTQYSDLVGLLMANVMKCIYQLDDMVERITNYDAITSEPFIYRISGLGFQPFVELR